MAVSAAVSVAVSVTLLKSWNHRRHHARQQSIAKVHPIASHRISSSIGWLNICVRISRTLHFLHRRHNRWILKRIRLRRSIDIAVCHRARRPHRRSVDPSRPSRRGRPSTWIPRARRCNRTSRRPRIDHPSMGVVIIGSTILLDDRHDRVRWCFDLRQVRRLPRARRDPLTAIPIQPRFSIICDIVWNGHANESIQGITAKSTGGIERRTVNRNRSDIRKESALLQCAFIFCSAIHPFIPFTIGARI